MLTAGNRPGSERYKVGGGRSGRRRGRLRRRGPVAPPRNVIRRADVDTRPLLPHATGHFTGRRAFFRQPRSRFVDREGMRSLFAFPVLTLFTACGGGPFDTGDVDASPVIDDAPSGEDAAPSDTDADASDGAPAVPFCAIEGKACANDTACCAGTRCNTGVCGVPGPACANIAHACASKMDGCGSMQCGGGSGHAVCVCQSSGGDCTTSAECCTGLACEAGVCTSPPNCKTMGDKTCKTSADCCASLQCLTLASLEAVECCVPTGKACRTPSDCCGTTACVDGQCNCRSAGAPCRQGQDCCGGVCTLGVCH